LRLEEPKVLSSTVPLGEQVRQLWNFKAFFARLPDPGSRNPEEIAAFLPGCRTSGLAEDNGRLRYPLVGKLKWKRHHGPSALPAHYLSASRDLPRLWRATSLPACGGAFEARRAEGGISRRAGTSARFRRKRSSGGTDRSEA